MECGLFVIVATRQLHAVATSGTVEFSAMRATRGALGTDFCYGCGGDTLWRRHTVATGTTVVSLSMREASGSGTFDWLVVRCGGSAVVVSSLESGASTR